MKMKYLGTAAAEGWPGAFCRCTACDEARKRGGKEIRTRSQALINKDLLIDLPADTYMHSILHNIDLSGIKHLLITHSHSDHFYPLELAMRGSCYSHNMTSEELHIYGSYHSKNHFYQYAGQEINEEIDHLIHWHILHAYEPIQADDYTITPLPARHMTEIPLMEPFFYLIEQNGRSLLYIHDTGRALDPVLDYLQKEKKHIDFVSFDCTCGLVDGQENGGHMGFPDAVMLREKMLARGICDDKTHYALNHFSHNNGILHKELCDVVEPENMDVAFDGMEVEI
ncbi:MAG: MBL fold metallo-hydrolase [Oscillospiraceae bacterium]